MFKRTHHQAIEQVLRLMNAELLKTHHCYFGGGTAIGLGTHTIKFEIVLEGRIQFERPTTHDEVCGITTLSVVDLLASKLLANSDRWADEGVFNRDLIDLAMMKPSDDVFLKGCAKAETAYGASIRKDLEKAIGKLLDKPDWLEKCLRAMNMNDTPPASIVTSILALERLLKK
jgi:hypothetical protein